ncbi:MAG: alpha-E domain-containing protein [Planctomycetia bacterium]|nr:alpha-E domain-containing protein [Planctomycetia bacterium]
MQRWLLLDMDNPGSVMACVNRSRNNARSIRGSISPPMWRELNKLYWRLSEAALPVRVAESSHDFCQETQIGVLLFHGVCEATLMHDEGWHFIQLGRHLERAEKVLRILDSTFGLLERGGTADLPIGTLRWGAVLKNCNAYEAYQRLYISRVEPERVVEFLLTNADFPHSVRFCLAAVLRSLTEISGRLPERCDDEVIRTVGRLLNDLVYLDDGAVDGERLHAFLGRSLTRCARIGSLLQQQYALH